MNIRSTIFLLVSLAFYALPVHAQGISKAQAKRIANQVIDARKPELRGQTGPEGPPGAPGPAGPPGSPGNAPLFLYAKVLPNGEVDESRSMGITSADVRLIGDVKLLSELSRGKLAFDPVQQSYCFMIPANGAQVTLDAEQTLLGATAGVFFLRREGCEFFVRITGRELTRSSAGFFITIY